MVPIAMWVAAEGGVGSVGCPRVGVSMGWRLVPVGEECPWAGG